MPEGVVEVLDGGDVCLGRQVEGELEAGLGAVQTREDRQVVSLVEHLGDRDGTYEDEDQHDSDHGDHDEAKDDLVGAAVLLAAVLGRHVADDLLGVRVPQLLPGGEGGDLLGPAAIMMIMIMLMLMLMLIPERQNVRTSECENA